MTDLEKVLNTKPLGAYETMKGDIYTKNIPGFEKFQDKDHFRRYNRRGISGALLG